MLYGYRLVQTLVLRTQPNSDTKGPRGGLARLHRLRNKPGGIQAEAPMHGAAIEVCILAHCVGFFWIAHITTVARYTMGSPHDGQFRGSLSSTAGWLPIFASRNILGSPDR